MRRKRLLLADDSITIQRVIELTFADEPIDVVTVGDGAAAMAELATFPPDVVLADIGMPPPDGYELALHVHRTPALSHIPVVLLTGAFDPVDHARASEARCAGILAKPFDPQMLVARVRDLVRGGSESASAPAATEVVEPAPVPAEPVPGPAASVTVVAATTTAADEYFEQLDRAFARLATTETRPDSQTPSAVRSAANPIDVVAVVDMDAPGTGSGQPHAGMNNGSSELAAEPESAFPVDVVDTQPSAPEDTQAGAPHARTALGEAFAALLAIEAGQSAAVPAVGSLVPADMVADLAARIGRETAERVVREITPDIVARVAERVLREEIARRTGQGSHR
jgi:DNA-binding response OmpR family regulator